MKPPLLFIILIALSVNGLAQSFSFRLQTDIPVTANGNVLENPWAGGLNSAQFSKMNLNADAVEDLVVFDRSSNKISTFIATKKADGSFFWKYDPRYETLFPNDLSNWVLLVDYDKDGRKDLFTSAVGGIRVFKNMVSDNGFSWQLTSGLLRTEGFSGNINLYVQATDLPAITDLDNDGDIDILAFDFSGNTVEYHQNFSVERGNKTPFEFRKVTTCWGNFFKEHCNDFKLGQTCPGLSAAPTNRRVAHAGNSIWVGDVNGDSKKDILFGHISCQNIAVLYNTGENSFAANVTSFSKDFPAQNPISYAIFQSVFVEDLDFDGRNDLVATPTVTTNDGNLIDFSQSNWFYRNEGTNVAPQFVYKQPNFIQNQMIDLGENAAPLLVDLDGDGDLDLLVGNAGKRDDKGSYRAGIAHFKNNGTPTKPAFELITTDFLGLAQKRQFFNAKPFAADLNGDGSVDVGYWANSFNGMTVRYIPNSAARGQAFQLDTARAVQLLNPVNFSNGENLLFYDIDNDGLTDILVGKSSGNVELHRNVGSATQPVYKLESAQWGGFDVNFDAHARSFVVADLNNDRQPELITSDYFGAVTVYPDFAKPNAILKADSNLIFNEFTNKNIFLRLGNSLFSTLGDLDGDQLPDLLLGNNTGGLTMLKNTSPKLNLPQTQTDLVVYPNPSERFLYVKIPAEGILELYNLEGKLIQQITASRSDIDYSFDVQRLPIGVYFVKWTGVNGRKKSQKVLIVK
jgi:Secretion system C-terminal sorting domain/FG-GAP-like repeat